jgi:hypothetical protein
MGLVNKITSFAMAAAVAGLACGCGTPGAPQPPSLNLPDRVDNLTAVRTGNQVALAWTMPRRNTDKLLLKGIIRVQVCRQQGEGKCIPAGDLELSPGVKGAFTDTLPQELSTGSPRPLAYFVELKNRKDRSSGPSNAAWVLAGVAPSAVQNFAARPGRGGVVLQWTPSREPVRPGTDSAVRLHRTLVSKRPEGSEAENKEHSDLLSPAQEPLLRSLRVAVGETGDPGKALDKDVRFGESYEYQAQRVSRLTVGGQELELDGELSAPVRIVAANIFPPAVPKGLVAVASVEEAGSPTAGSASIDLSWQPDSDLGQIRYFVYRREGDGAWQRISSGQPLTAPVFRDVQVRPGHTYRYAVTAIDDGTPESSRSEEAVETVPAQE